MIAAGKRERERENRRRERARVCEYKHDKTETDRQDTTEIVDRRTRQRNLLVNESS